MDTHETHRGLHCLQIADLSVVRGGSSILEHVNLHIHCGGLTAVIGRNGAGKSTLLRAILGELPYTGRIEFSGHDGKKVPRLRIGYVPQTLSIDAGAPATVYDMMLSLTSRWPVFLPRRKKDRERLSAHLARFNAAPLLDRQLGGLSGGELQRVLLAAATLPRPDLLILDEPVSGVDQAGLDLFYDLLNRLKVTDDMVILLVSHDLDYVRRCADQVILLDKTVEMAGPPDRVFTSEAFARSFGQEKGGDTRA
ncbi:MAG: metal ABC transporter ATP-binding protein [Clostridiales bacterium]|nr:metal ABC transporter ATP-binding protein [Clostridiales bacterium]